MSRNILLGNNSLADYLIILLIYLLLFVIIRYGGRKIELNFRKTFWVLFWGWGISLVLGNYLFYLIGIMSFLPWLNNFFHSFLWVGFCLAFLYSNSFKLPWWEQFILFAAFSAIVKYSEHFILGTWELDYFFFIEGNTAYIIGWSLMDGLYPAISAFMLNLLHKIDNGIISPIRLA